jgi:hypothetical protein
MRKHTYTSVGNPLWSHKYQQRPLNYRLVGSGQLMWNANLREFENQTSLVKYEVGSKHQPAEISCPSGRSQSSSLPLTLFSNTSECSDTQSHQSLLASSEELQLQCYCTVLECVTEVLPRLTAGVSSG